MGSELPLVKTQHTFDVMLPVMSMTEAIIRSPPALTRSLSNVLLDSVLQTNVARSPAYHKKNKQRGRNARKGEGATEEREMK